MPVSDHKIIGSTPSMRAYFLFVVLFIAISASSSVQAQNCGEEHVVVRGESLSKIALRVYGDTQKWTLIYNVNFEAIGANPNLLLVGQQLRIPCLVEKAALKPAPIVDKDVDKDINKNQSAVATDNTGSEDVKSAATTSTQPSSTPGRESGNTIRFLTADDYAPFTDRKLINNGLVTDMLTTALTRNPDKPSFEINWVNDWSTHLDPLLSSHEYDMGFPWLQPDCKSTPDEYRCQNFRFSYPVFQMLVLLFVDKNQPLVFESDEDIAGAVLCRPKGYYTHDLEKDGRLWLTNNVIELKQPDSIKDCFDMLSNGSVDAVALNEFTGRSAVARLSMEDQVVVLEGRPLSIEGLHVVVHKDHPRAAELIDTVNESMSELQLSEAYSVIVETHFRKFWSTIE